MKKTIIAPMAFGILVASAQTKEHTQESRAEATAEARADGNVEKQTVTVTSDGINTTKTTTTVRNGVKEVVTEITDAQGNTRRIPDDAAEKNAPDHKKDNEAKKPSSDADGNGHPWIGVHVKAASPELRSQLNLAENDGVVVVELAPNGPAAKAGLQINDIILTLEKEPISSPQDLREALHQHDVGETVALEIIRRGEKKEITVTLEAQPTQQQEKNPRAPKQPNGAKTNRNAHAEAHAGTNFDDVLENPRIPEDVKNRIREMKKHMEELQKKHQFPR